MVLSLIFGKKYAKSSFNDTNTDFPIITFDTMLSEEHKYTSKVTAYPVERGTIVSDHILKYPVQVSLSGYITDTPLSFLSVLASFNRSTAAFDRLVQLYETRSVFTVVTGLKVYRNMTIVTLDVPRTIKTGQALIFNIVLQQIVYSDIVNQLVNATNIFIGTQTIRSNDIVAENTNFPILQNDPPFSLKDEASTNSNVGIQTLAPLAVSTLANVATMYRAIKGV